MVRNVWGRPLHWGWPKLASHLMTVGRMNWTGMTTLSFCYCHLPCNLTCPHFLAHPNLTPVIAFPHFITRVASSFTSGLHLLTPCPDQPSPSCSLAPFVSFQLPVFIMLISPLLSHKAFPTSSRGTTSGSNPFSSLVSLLSHTSGVFVSPALKWLGED